MRAVARALLMLLAFAIPWEYSLDFGPPLGNIARLAALAVLLALIPALLLARGGRAPGPLQWLVLALFIWLCCSSLWSIDSAETLRDVRGYVQDYMIVWLIWELIDTPQHMRNILRACVAGAYVLAALTIYAFLSGAAAADQARFVAEGQDPNDVARYLNLLLPLAALLVCSEPRRAGRLLASAYLPVGFLAVLLTASRSGLVGSIAAFCGCGILLARRYRHAITGSLFALPAVLGALWLVIPRLTLERLATIPEQVGGGDLNQRLNIWQAGWQAFTHAPFFGYGAGSFVAAAGLAPMDTAHETALAFAVETGIVGLFIGFAILAVSALNVLRMHGPVRVALATSLLTCVIASLTATVQTDRMTWLLLGIIATAARLASEQSASLEHAFTASPRALPPALTAGAQP